MKNAVQYQESALFVGSFMPTLDAKRRIVFPAVWRSLVGEPGRLFAFPHPDEKCLHLYTEREMGRRLARLREGGALDETDRRAIRSFAAGAEMLAWDAQGRVRIGEALLAHVEAKERLALVGMLTCVELWSAEHFDLALPAGSAKAEDAFFGGF